MEHMCNVNAALGGGHKTASDKESGRVVVYDWVRLLAMIYVVIGHSAYTSIQSAFGSIVYNLPPDINSVYDSIVLSFLRRLPDWIYSFHMPLFFCLSRAVLALKPVGQFDVFVKSKCRRLLYPYFICSWLFVVPVKYISGFYNKDNVFAAMQGLLSGQEGSHLWFLPALFWCMVCFVILQKILYVKAKVHSEYFLLLSAGMIQLLYLYLPFDVLVLKQGIGYIFWFALGYVFECERRRHRQWNIRTTATVFVLLTVIEILNWRHGILNSFFMIVCGSFHTYLLADICSRVFKNVEKNKGWQFVISNLFYVYLFHDPLEYVVLRIFMSGNWLSSSFGCYAYTFSRTVLIFLISILSGGMVKWIKEKLNYFLNGVSSHSERGRRKSVI